MRPRLRALAGTALLALALAGAATGATTIRARVSLAPGTAKLGERVLYRGRVILPAAAQVRWLPAEAGGALTWGQPVSKPGSGRSEGGLHEVAVEVPLQAFALGTIPIPGLRFEVDEGGRTTVHRLPVSSLTIQTVLAAADSNADFRPVRGPIAAPWWERVPWVWVVLGALLIAAIVFGIVWARRRRRRPLPHAPIEARKPLDPLAEALAALHALRGLHLPEHGRFAEHAFRLGQILRRYLEATVITTRPGDTTPELVDHLRETGLGPDDLKRLAGLLRTWDRVKFAREPMTVEEATLTETTVEAFLRRPANAPAGKVA